MRHQAIYNLYPQVVSILEDFTCKDAEDNLVLIDPTSVDTEEDILRFSSSKVAKLQEIEEQYLQALDLDIPYMGTAFQADKYSRDLVVTILSAGAVPSGFFWLDALNNQVPMTYSELQGLSAEMIQRGQLDFVNRLALKTQLSSATTQSDLDEIVW